MQRGTSCKSQRWELRTCRPIRRASFSTYGNISLSSTRRARRSPISPMDWRQERDLILKEPGSLKQTRFYTSALNGMEGRHLRVGSIESESVTLHCHQANWIRILLSQPHYRCT